MWKLSLALSVAVTPVALYAFAGGSGPPVKVTGVPTDRVILPGNRDVTGVNCTSCHASFVPANSDGTGRVRIEVGNYNPGVRQRIRVTVEHPEASRWGFQITARAVNDLTKSVGVFQPNENVQIVCEDAANPLANFRGVAGPCNGRLEFAQHTTAGTAAGTRQSRTFDLDWDPPSTEVGDILFFVAGNAANGNGANSLDRIYTTVRRVSSTGACAALTKRPMLRSITDAAAYQRFSSINGIATIFGQDFQVSGMKRSAGLGDFSDGRYPTELACVGVEVGGERAPIFYVQNDQINFQVPTIAAIGDVPVRVILNPGAPTQLVSDVGTFRLQNYSPAVFPRTRNTGAALIAGTEIPVTTDTATFPTGRPARPGETIELYVNGLGLAEPVYRAGEIVGPSGTGLFRGPALTVSLGGVDARITYAGLAPLSLSGLFQINLVVPAALADGDHPLVVQIAGVNSQTGVILPVRR